MINGPCTARYARINGLTALPLRTGGASKFLVGLFATFVTLLVLWCTAGKASAATYEESCSRRPMTQGLVGEQVTTCELRRVPSTIVATARPLRGKLDKDGTCGGLPAACCDARTGSAALCKVRPVRRPGRTTVVHYGVRSVARLASR